MVPMWWKKSSKEWQPSNACRNFLPSTLDAFSWHGDIDIVKFAGFGIFLKIWKSIGTMSIRSLRKKKTARFCHWWVWFKESQSFIYIYIRLISCIMFARLATTAITGTTPMEMAHWQKRKWHLYLFIWVWPEALREDSQLFWLEICVFWTRYPRGQRFLSRAGGGHFFQFCFDQNRIMFWTCLFWDMHPGN